MNRAVPNEPLVARSPPSLRAQAEAIPFAFLGPSGRMTAPCNPIVIEGVGGLWLHQRLLDATSPLPDGYAPRLLAVVERQSDLDAALARRNLRDLPGGDRFVWFVGPGARDRLHNWLSAHLHTSLPDRYLLAPDTAPFSSPAVPDVLRRAHATQADHDEALAAAILPLYANRDRAWWTRRFQSGLPLRVLLPISRFSTFLRHSAADIAGTLRTAGHEAFIVTEPDDFTRLSSIAYLERLAQWQPDLVIGLNHPRSRLPKGSPANIPFVCWIQDAMPHLFDPSVVGAQGELDFLVGHVSDDIQRVFSLPPARILACPVAVCGRKFHAAPIHVETRRRFECEIAYVSHQSETPEAFIARLIAAQHGSAVSTLAVKLASTGAATIARDPMQPAAWERLRTAAADALRAAIGNDPDARAVATLFHQCCMPVAERIVRHDMLRWAAGAARRNGWRFHLYGRGWDLHPDLAEFARAEVDHGEDLRACYQSAVVHLHASMNSLVHQRVLECALSGGLPLCRLNRDELGAVMVWALEAALRNGGPELATLHNRMDHCLVGLHPELMRLNTIYMNLGMPHQVTHGIGQSALRALEKPWLKCGDIHADWLLGDLVGMTFRDEPALECRIRRAVEDPGWRGQRIDEIAYRVRSRLTYSSILDRVLGMVDRVPAARGISPAS